MPAGLVPLLKRKISGLDPLQLRCRALGRHFEELDEIAWKIGVTPIARQMRDYAEDPQSAWFNPKRGQITLTALVTYLLQNPQSVSEQEDVLEDLRAVKQVLSRASEEKVDFHFVLY